MIKYCTNIFLVFILLLCYSNTNGYNVPQAQDTTKTHILDELGTRKIEKKDYKLSKKEFIKRYAFDENSEKLISKYFEYRYNLFYLISSPFIIALLFIILALIIGPSILTIYSLKFAFYFFIMLMLYIAYQTAWVFRIIALFKLIKRKKRKFLLELIEYRKQYNLNIQKND